MLYNLICFAGFIISVALSALFVRFRFGKVVLRVLSVVLFIYKTAYYVIENVRGNVSIPVEISNISYFLVPIILTFKIKKLYSVGSFFGIAAGVGYFLFYSVCGFTVEASFTLQQILTGCFCHGYLFVCGIYLFKNCSFRPQEKAYIWLALFAMLSWSLVFYDVQTRGITFIYYIIKPKFLFVFENIGLNALLVMAYYSVLALAFCGVVKLFFVLHVRTAVNNGKRKIKCRRIRLFGWKRFGRISCRVRNVSAENTEVK